MKKLLVVMMILVLAVSFAFAQAEDLKDLTVGLRGGRFSGLTGRMLNDGKGIEALVTTGNSGFVVAGLYEFHKPLKIGEIEGLTWYWGGGAHVGISGWWTNSISLGLDAIVGVEYSLESLINFPLSVSLDYKPAIDIFGGWGTDWFGFTGSLRYTF